MKNKNVVIVGANKGIGLELVRAYIEKGATVFALCRNSNDALKSLSPYQIITGFEVTNYKILTELSSELRLNKEPIHLLFHNAGVWEEEHFPFKEEDFNNMSKLFEINSIAPLKVVTVFLKYFEKGSKIALMSSQMGSIEDNRSGKYYNYRMSKAALNIAGKSLSLDLKKEEISVAICHPGYVQTEMTDFKGHITTKESVQGLVKVIDHLSMENTGKFWNYQGKELPW
jgi:short-subunit dehydrogenase